MTPVGWCCIWRMISHTHTGSLIIHYIKKCAQDKFMDWLWICLAYVYLTKSYLRCNNTILQTIHFWWGWSNATKEEPKQEIWEMRDSLHPRVQQFLQRGIQATWMLVDLWKNMAGWNETLLCEVGSDKQGAMQLRHMLHVCFFMERYQVVSCVL